MVPEENIMMEKKPFPCYPRNYIMEIAPSEWIDGFKKITARQTNA